MGEVAKMGVPGRFPSLTLGIVAVITVIFPIVSLPCSITGFVHASKAKKFISKHEIPGDAVSRVGYFLNLTAIIVTVSIMLLAIPGAIERNLR
jgi:hypothetical protein